VVAPVSLLLLGPVERLGSVSRLSSVSRRRVILLLLLLLEESRLAIRSESLLYETRLRVPVRWTCVRILAVTSLRSSLGRALPSSLPLSSLAPKLPESASELPA
jgi:hypothetical protein